MRAAPSPRSGVVLMDDVDLLFHYRLNEASAANDAADAGPDGFDLTQAGSPAVSGAVYNQTGTTVGARVFDAATDYFSATATSYAASAQGENSVWAWVFPTTVSGTQCLAYLGGTGATGSGNNTQMVLRLVGDEVSLEWQHSTNTAVTSTTTGAALVNDELYFILATRENDPDNAGKYRVRIDVWALNDKTTRFSATGTHGLQHQEYFANLTGPDGGGTTGRMVIGSDYDFTGQSFTGELSDVGMSRRALSYEWGREQFARAARDFDLNGVVNKPSAYHARGRVRVLDPDGNWIDLNRLAGRGWLASGSTREHIDDPVGQARLSLVREHARRSNSETSPVLSIAPGMEDSPLNNYTSDQLVRGKTRVKLDIAVIPDRGISPRDPYEWEHDLHWDGYVADMDAADFSMGVPVDGRGVEAMDLWLTRSGTYSSDSSPQSIETTVQELFDDAIANYHGAVAPTYLSGPNAPTVRVPVATGTNINAYTQEPDAVLSCGRALGDEVGFDLRYRFIPGLREYVPNLEEPDRSKATVDWTFAAEDVSKWDSIRYGTRDIRNAIHVVALDSNGDRIEVTRTDSTSIAKYGYLWAEINEGSAHRIDSTAEITALGDAALAELKEPVIWASCTLAGFFPLVETWDRYTFAADGRTRDQSVTACVIGFEHVLAEDGSITTKLELRGDTPAAKARTWGTMLVGYQQSPSAPLYTMQTPTGLAATAGVGHSHFQWDTPDRDILRNFDVYEVWTGATSGFTTASGGTLRARVRTNAWSRGGLTDPSAVDGYVKIRAVDIWGNASALTSAVTYSATYTTTTHPAFKAYGWDSGGGSWSSTPGWRTYRADTEAYDTGADYDNATNFEFTAPVTGVYRFGGVATWAALTADRTLSARIVDDSGTPVVLATPVSRDVLYDATYGASPADLKFSWEVALTSGDKVRLQMDETDGSISRAPLQSTEQQTYWAGELIAQTA